MTGIALDDANHLLKPATVPTKRKRVSFNEEEVIINPEDVDPNVGRFRNLVQTSIIPVANKKPRIDPSPSSEDGSFGSRDLLSSIFARSSAMYSAGNSKDKPNSSSSLHRTKQDFITNPLASLGISLPNPTPDIEPSSSASTQLYDSSDLSGGSESSAVQVDNDLEDPHSSSHHKKYVKEAWPRNFSATTI